jgi:hypothetical protein
MFKVLRVDGPNIVTDIGCVSLNPFQYADGGKTKPVSIEDWKKIVALFAASPDLLAACQEALSMYEVQLQLDAEDDPTCKMLRAAIAKAEGG